MVFNLYLNAARPHARRRFGEISRAIPRWARVRILPRAVCRTRNASLSCAYYCELVATLPGYEIEIRERSLFCCGCC